MDTIKCETIKKDEFVISRVFDSSRENLWKTLTTTQWNSWWLPDKYKLYEADLQKGGKYYGCIEQPDGKDFCVKGEFREVIPNEKLVMTDTFADKESIVAPADYYGKSETWPSESLISVTFDDLDGKTRMTLQHSGLQGYSCNGMEQEWNKFFDELDNEIKKETKGDYSIFRKN
jgi:uncharacterized protein YndB with AHSA1/START domain